MTHTWWAMLKKNSVNSSVLSSFPKKRETYSTWWRKKWEKRGSNPSHGWSLRLATALPVLKNHLRTTAHIDARNHKWIQCEHRCFTVYGTQMFRVVSVLLSVWKRKSVLVETNGRCKNIFLSSQHRGTNMTRCQDFLKLGTGHSVKHRCLNALSPSLAPAKAHIVASLS